MGTHNDKPTTAARSNEPKSQKDFGDEITCIKSKISNSVASLVTILREALMAILSRWKQMPRGGWPRLKSAKGALLRFKVEGSRKRVKSFEDVFSTTSLQEVPKYVEGTLKVCSLKVDLEIIEMLNKVAARVLQCLHLSYESLTVKKPFSSSLRSMYGPTKSNCKMLATPSDNVLNLMVNETKEFFRTVGLEMNIDKSATNSVICEDDAKLLGSHEGYKVGKNMTNTTKCEKFNTSSERICDLSNKLFCWNCGNGARPVQVLYLPRNELGRGLNSVELKSERMLFQLNNTLKSNQELFLRRKAILKIESNGNTHLSKIEGFLKCKYNIEGPVTIKLLDEAQKSSLYNKNRPFDIHQGIFSLV
ncbi:hypothetical protein NAPIS_ORF00061 [Vairimorpha apis BRL 01]|uniref:Uncharacterized protein n=1 Tax=Vairimorpha apis BRL 01 TaxID=1037528 RepID=T0MGV6_9MICR|nr:hypothetical protein NAPIS_ORF00061 [Vairimorpha apis BRL 01]